jgi:D-3-phosphoglycerate dehydrogenase/(S)-sulfolactate dehydrogenase
MARCLVTSLFIQSIDDPALAPLIADGHEILFVDGLSVRSEAALADALQGVAATLASVEPYTAQVLSEASDLQVISRTGVGYDAVDVAAATERGVVVCTTPGTNHHAVADLAVLLILACARRLPEAMALLRRRAWTPQPIGLELRGSTVGIIGTGLIGGQVAQRLAGFEPRLLGYDVVHNAALVERFGLRYVGLDELLAQSDFVTVHAPLLPETHHLIGAAALAQMKPSAYLVNTARGPLVDELAVAAALREGRLAGAALDVFETEPLPVSSPLRDVEHLLLTPHIAGITVQSQQAMAAMAVQNAVRVLRGEAPLSCVNPEVLSVR